MRADPFTAAEVLEGLGDSDGETELLAVIEGVTLGDPDIDGVVVGVLGVDGLAAELGETLDGPWGVPLGEPLGEGVDDVGAGVTEAEAAAVPEGVLVGVAAAVPLEAGLVGDDDPEGDAVPEGLMETEGVGVAVVAEEDEAAGEGELSLVWDGVVSGDGVKLRVGPGVMLGVMLG